MMTHLINSNSLLNLLII